MINEKQARKFCKEDISKIKNYDAAIADKTQTWHCHHMTETWWNCSAKDLIENECYYNRKACELIFLTQSEHRRLHMKGDKNPMYGRTGDNNPSHGLHRTEETKLKISNARKRLALKGRPSNRKGVTLSDETRRKMTEAAKRRWANKRVRVMEDKLNEIE